MASPPSLEGEPARVVGERFKLTRLIGEGAFAHVYRAVDLQSGGDVAVKILKEGLRADREIAERFRREVLAVSAIDSPHVVRLHDFGVTGAESFIAMEYVEGPTLRDLLGIPLSPETAHIVVGQIGQAVAAAHDKGIIHRDLKPENIVLVKGARGRQVKVLDFGLAKLAQLEERLGLEQLTKDGMCFGTPQYMSPEQIQGRTAERSADLWALTVMAYELLAGRRPWDGEEIRDVFYAILGKRLPDIETAHPALVRRDEVNRFFARALSVSPAERPADATELFGAFEQALFGGPHAPAATVFNGIMSAEFVVAGDHAAAAPATPTLDDGRLAVTPDSPARSSKRKLRSVWSTSVEQLPPSSTTQPGEAQRAEAPPVSANSDAPPPPVPANSDAPPLREPPAAVVPTSAAAAAPRARSMFLLVVVLALALATAVVGYVLGRRH
jgi:serine/threonine protein kinase